MAPPILFLTDIHLTFGGNALLEGVEMSVEAGDRICLVGRNGSGKSTLLKIAAGMVEMDRGERFLQPGTTVNYLEQEPNLLQFDCVTDYVNDGLNGPEQEHVARMLLGELGLSGEEKTKALSGGEARKAALIRSLAPQPDVLLLDEPTNHLDLPAIEWLENWLRKCRSALVLISHDRRFLSSLSRKTVWMDRGASRVFERGFGEFEEWRDGVLEEEEMQRHKLGRKIAREEHWIVHGVSGRRKRNVRRLRELGDLKHQKATAKKVAPGVKITVAEGEASGKLVARLHNVSKNFGDKKIVHNLSAIIQRGDRVGLVGPNGAGKTTLVNLITTKLAPDSGNIKLGVNLDLLVIDQKREMLDPEWTLKDALTDGSGDMVAVGDEQKHVFTYMRDFLFLPEQAGTPLRVLSGGERGRLMLARGFRHPSNFLVLDEPTNDLDLETLDLLQEKISEYEGTVILVSHDRDFLDRICTTVIAYEGEGNWAQYAGGYSDMMAQRSARGGKGSGVTQVKIRGKTKSKSVRNSSQKPVEAKLSFAQLHALENLPKEIERLEFEIGKLKNALGTPGLYTKDPKKFDGWVKALGKREQALSAKEDEWLELEARRETVGD
ncbi:MAG: ATP-binding cassette domain-containing protein [Rhizobiaceae bacterium]|nr:ATP-binding cassette domain-containing protein [Rhizobiaceae bacterium]